jgi:hypothetical protein
MASGGTMKRATLLLLVVVITPALVMCYASKPAPSPTTATATRGVRADEVNCPAKDHQIAVELRPQGIAYRANEHTKCIEKLLYIKDYSPDAPTQTVRGYFEGRTDSIQIRLERRDRDTRHPLYQATIPSVGLNLCELQPYDALQEELDAACDGGRCAAITKLDNNAMVAPGYWALGQWHERNGL